MSVVWKWLSGFTFASAIALLCVGQESIVTAQQAAPANPLRSTASRVGTGVAASNAVPATTAARQAGRSRASATAIRYPQAVLAAGASHGSAGTVRPTNATMITQMASADSSELVAPDLPATAGEGVEVIDGGIIDGGVIYEGAAKGLQVLPPGLSACGGDCGTALCTSGCLIPCPVITLKNTEIFAGVQGFTGPTNRGETGSFGFHEGFNWGIPAPCTGGALAGQIGLRTTQSNLSGAEFSDSTRNQLFLTAGLFRRVDWGLQGGLAVDYLSEDWYANVDLVQLRGELSWVFPCTHEVGFWFTAGTGDDQSQSDFSGGVASQVETWEPTDLYAFFYRRRFEQFTRADARIYAGFTGESDGLLGADLYMPLGVSFALRTGFNYLIPEEATGVSGRGHEQEAWNVGISLVWYPGCRIDSEKYFTPLFDVADNGTFMIDRR